MSSNNIEASNHQSPQIGPVLLVALSKGYGGADVRVFDLAQAFHGRIPYTVATIKGSLLQQKLTAANLSTHPLPYARSDPRLLWHIRRLIQDKDFRVVDAHNPQSQWWGLWAAQLTAVSSLVSTVHHAYGRVENLRRRDQLYEKVLQANIRWGCQFVTVSQSIYEYLLEIGVNEDDLSLIHNAIDLHETASQPPDYSWREKLGWGDDTVVVIVVGRLEVQKGHKYLLEAMNLAVKKQPQLRCLLVGDGRLRPELERQIHDLGLAQWVHLAGFRQDVTALLGSSHIFCLSSLYEGLPYALLEAAAYRLPFVVTAVDGMAELLTNEQNALLVPPADPAALADALCRLADDPQKRANLGQASYTLVKQQFAPDVMMAETLSIYQKNLTPTQI